MKLQELLSQLNDLPVDALQKDVFLVDADGELLGDLLVEAITESCDDPTVVGYVIVETKQLDLPFEKVN